MTINKLIIDTKIKGTKQYTQRWWQNKITRMYKVDDNRIMQNDLLN